MSAPLSVAVTPNLFPNLVRIFGLRNALHASSGNILCENIPFPPTYTEGFFSEYHHVGYQTKGSIYNFSKLIQ